jgi:CheY-like chemotaxis protein
MATPRAASFAILVIDDDATVRDMVTEVLQADGHLVFSASGGEEGLAILEAVLPDLILVDRHMPGMNGLEVVRRLRAGAATRRTPIVAMTSAIGEEASELTRAGCIAFIPKPFNPTEFRRLIADLVRVTIARRHHDSS